MILCLGTTPAAQRVMRFSRLTLNAVNRATSTLDGIAGKSVNLAKVLDALGERPLATGFLGGARGEAIRAILMARGIESEFVTVAGGTRECVTVIDESAGTHTELVEESAPADPADFARLLAIVQRRMPACRAAVMSGTIAPGGPADLYAQCVRLAHEAGALALVDAQGPSLTTALSAGPDLVKPNRAELAATVGRELADEPAVLAAMRELTERGARRVVVTAGREPTLLLDGAHVWRIRSPQLVARNPIGSGDAFTAGVVWRLVQGDDLGEAGRWGSAAGAANALTWMAGEVSWADVERLARDIQVERL